MKYYVSPHLLCRYDENRRIVQRRPNYADPEYGGYPRQSFLLELYERQTYYPDMKLKALKDAPIIFKGNRPLYPGIPTTQSYGRGLLGKWGPNHAADPIPIRYVLRWSHIIPTWKAYALVVQREDTGEWALAGGMVDPGEEFTETASRELREEAISAPSGTIEALINDTLNRCILYKGINWNDPRNTYNAWMETCVVMFIIPTWLSFIMQLRPQIGETRQVKWLDLESDVSMLYSDHGFYVNMARKKIGGSFECNNEGLLIFLEDTWFNLKNLMFLFIFVYLCCVSCYCMCFS